MPRRFAKRRDNGRALDGRFLPGCAPGPGSPQAKRAAHFKQLVLDATTDRDVELIWRKLVELAKGGESWAVKEVFDRLWGRPVQVIDAPDDVRPPVTSQEIAAEAQRIIAMLEAEGGAEPADAG